MAGSVLAGLLAPPAIFLGAWAGLLLRDRRLARHAAAGPARRVAAALALGVGLAAGTLLGGLAAPRGGGWALAAVLGAVAVALGSGGAVLLRPARANPWRSGLPVVLLAGGALGAALLLFAGRGSGPSAHLDPLWPLVATVTALLCTHAARVLAEPTRWRAGGGMGWRQIGAAAVFGLGITGAQAALGRTWAGTGAAAPTAGLGPEAMALLACVASLGLAAGIQLAWARDAAGAAAARRALAELRTALARLDGEMRNHRRAREALAAANRSLRARIELEQRLLADARALGELGRRLLACHTEAEIARLLAVHAGRVLPGSAGMLLRRMPGTNEYVAAARWGAPLGLARIATPQCLALRDQRPRQLRGNAMPRCAHLAGVKPDHVVSCVPLHASGEDVGLLCIELPAERELGYLEQFATGIADRVALALGGVRLRAQAIRDPLTGLYNRRMLEEALGREIARAERDGKRLALVLFDIDEFKPYNDRFGHDVGDHAIRAVADSLRARLRSSDVLCRYGGEEFLALLTDTRLHEAVNRAREVSEHVRGLLATDPQLKRRITLSAGVAAFPDHGTQAIELLRAADAALYAAKSAGRDRVVLARS